MLADALFVVDKPPGPTSFDVVRSLKRVLGKAKIGHTGSLDPFASGVLILLVGRATKLSNILINADKSYFGRARLGTATDSMDGTGAVVETEVVPELTREAVEAALKSFEGTWYQTPPMFSAKKVKGVRLYELARQQISIRREPIPVKIYSTRLVSFEAPFIEFEVHCSKGTYIRSLADELGRRLGTVGHLEGLRRLSCGEFELSQAVTVEDLTQNFGNHQRQGWEHYVNFLKSERMVRGARQHLQRPAPGGMSLGNYKGSEGVTAESAAP